MRRGPRPLGPASPRRATPAGSIGSAAIRPANCRANSIDGRSGRRHRRASSRRLFVPGPRVAPGFAAGPQQPLIDLRILFGQPRDGHVLEQGHQNASSASRRTNAGTSPGRKPAAERVLPEALQLEGTATGIGHEAEHGIPEREVLDRADAGHEDSRPARWKPRAGEDEIDELTNHNTCPVSPGSAWIGAANSTGPFSGFCESSRRRIALCGSAGKCASATTFSSGRTAMVDWPVDSWFSLVPQQTIYKCRPRHARAKVCGPLQR